MIRTRVGYCGGSTPDPTYRDIGDHAEALQVDFDPDRLSFEELLEVFWKSHDPTRGHFSTQYAALVFAADEKQRSSAEATGLAAAAHRGGALCTSIVRFERFYRAEDYHQKYRLRRHPALVRELIVQCGNDRAMVDSTVAAVLNGYLGGHGGRDANRRLADLDLSEPARALVRQHVA